MLEIPLPLTPSLLLHQLARLLGTQARDGEHTSLALTLLGSGSSQADLAQKIKPENL